VLGAGGGFLQLGGKCLVTLERGERAVPGTAIRIDRRIR
jgi:hypothetical protein